MTPWRAGTLTVHTTPTNAPTVPTRGPTLRTQSAQASSPGPARGSLRAQVTLGADRDGLDNREARKRPMEHAQAPFSCRLDGCVPLRGVRRAHTCAPLQRWRLAYRDGVRVTPPWTRQYWSDRISSGSACFRPGRGKPQRTSRVRGFLTVTPARGQTSGISMTMHPLAVRPAPSSTNWRAELGCKGRRDPVHRQRPHRTCRPFHVKHPGPPWTSILPGRATRASVLAPSIR